MDIRRYRNGSHQVRGNARRPFRHVRRIQKIANSATVHSSLLPDHYFIWDPTEPVATRPLAWKRGTSVAYYTHDGNKNVSEVIASNNDVAAHYEYAPFGALTVPRGTSAAANPWRFSSEYAEDDTATVYYNYRHYEPVTGRWLSRDPIEEDGGVALYGFVANSLSNGIDTLGTEVLDKGVVDVNPRNVIVEDVRWPNGYSWGHYDKYRYVVTGDKSCDEFNHAHIQNVDVTGDYLGSLDSLGWGFGKGSLSVGISRDYVAEAVVRPPTTNESGTCIYIAIDISVYSIYGVSLGAGGKIGKISAGASVGPLKGKRFLGSKVVNVTHCCCKDDK